MEIIWQNILQVKILVDVSLKESTYDKSMDLVCSFISISNSHFYAGYLAMHLQSCSHSQGLSNLWQCPELNGLVRDI